MGAPSRRAKAISSAWASAAAAGQNHGPLGRSQCFGGRAEVGGITGGRSGGGLDLGQDGWRAPPNDSGCCGRCGATGSCARSPTIAGPKPRC